MPRGEKKRKTETNASAYNKLKRLELRCPHCRPNKGENIKCYRKHGITKPKYKDKR